MLNRQDKFLKWLPMSAHHLCYYFLLYNNVTANYRKADANTQRTINRSAKKIATDFKLDDRIEYLAEREAFATLKDHKDM